MTVSVKTYTITFDANGVSVSPSTITVNAGATATLPTPTYDENEFAGWYTAASGGTQYTDSTAITGNVTLYAQ